MSDALVCILSPTVDTPTDALRRHFDHAADHNDLSRFTWTTHGRFTIGLACGAGGWTTQCRGSNRSDLVVAGCIRLDNRAEVAGWGAAAERAGFGSSDLDLVLRVIDARGPRCIPHLLGDFAFVVWDAREQMLHAVRDALGVRPLFVREEGALVLLSTHAGLLANDREHFDLEYIADYLVGGEPSAHSIHPGVRPIAPGSVTRWRYGSSSVERYWSADRFETDNHLAARASEQVEEFRRLFAEGIRSRLADGQEVWSQLSGGLDSSSIVSAASWLVETGQIARGIAGTVTYVAGMGGDERAYSDCVVERYAVRNELLSGHWMFQHDGVAPPATDHPYPGFPMYARDRRSAFLMRDRGARVLLTGHGSDQYLTGNRYFLADLLATGQSRSAVRETIAWAVAERQSAWRMGFQSAVVPLLPPFLQRRLVEGAAVAPWILRSFSRRFALRDRLPLVRQFAVPAGRKFDGPTLLALAHASSGPAGGVTDNLVESRFPFLYRPLVELGLRLPPPLRIRPRTTKWIQREAMRGILPEKVRCRRTKGAIDGSIEWALARERERIDAMLDRSILRELGCIDVKGVRRALEAARGGDSTALGAVVPLLSLESWLQVRVDRRPLRAHHDRIDTSKTAVSPSIAV